MGMKKISMIIFWLLVLWVLYFVGTTNAGTVPIIYNASWLPSNTWGVTVVPNMTLSGIIWVQTGQMWGVRIPAPLRNATPFYFRQDGSAKEFQLHINDWLAKVVQVKLIQSGTNVAAYISYARSNWIGSLWADFDIIASTGAPIAISAWSAWYGSPMITLLVDDATIPVATLSWSATMTIAQGSVFNDPGARWTDNLDGTGSTYTWSWSTTWSFQVSGSVNTAVLGTYTLQYQKVDRGGNKSNVVVRTVQVTDQTPPDTTITTWILSGSISNISGQSFSFISNETWSTFECKINSSPWQICSSPFATWYSDGVYIFSVRAKDIANNIDTTPASRVFTIDTIAPTAPTVTVNIDSPYSIDNPQIFFTGSYDIRFDHYEISIDWGAFAIQNSPYVPWWLVPWSHVAVIRAYDSVWNYSQTEVKFPPVAEIAAPTTLSSGNITDTTILIKWVTGDMIQSIVFSGVWWGFNCWILPKAVPITCTGGVISTSWIFEVSASNGVVTWKTSQMYIIDTVSPTVILNWSANITVAHGSTYTDSWASWTDNVDGWDSVLTGIWWGLWSFALSWTVNTNILGTYTLAYQKVDRVGNKTTVTRTVNVLDQTPPVVTINGSSTVDVLKNTLYIESGATWTDNIDGTWTNVIMSWSVNTWVVGSYSVEYTHIDNAWNTGNTVTRTVNVILWDTPIMTLNGSGLVTIEVHNTYTDLGVTATDTEQWNMTASVVMSWVVDIHTLWTYTIEYLLTDAQWNTAIPVTRTIQVADTTPPLINLLWGASASVVKWYAYVDSGATCTDNYDTTCVVNASGTVNTWVIGNYLIAYNAVDINGNNATWVIRTIQVITGSVPVITLNGSWVMTVAQGSTYIDLGATAIDNEDGNITINMTTSWSVNTNIIWTYVISYSVIDRSGNTGNTVTRTVNVTDQTAPVVTLQWSWTVVVAQWWSYIDVWATWIDNVDGSGNTYTWVWWWTWSYQISGSVNTATVWTYELWYQKVDNTGNKSTITKRIVQVTDQTPPQLILLWNNPIVLGYWFSFTDPWAKRNDNVDWSWVVMWTSSWNISPTSPGSYTLTYNYTDSAWNMATPITRVVIVKQQEFAWWWMWSTLVKDNCPNGDYSVSIYDGICGTKPENKDDQYDTCTLGTELEKAYCFARKNNITTIDGLERANATWSLIRQDLAKMMVNFSINVLDNTWTITQVCEQSYNDIQWVSLELKQYIKLWCSMWIMWLQSDWKTPLVSFRSTDTVTRAEFGTVLSRVLYGNTYDVWLKTNINWYEKHLQNLYGQWFIKNIVWNWPSYIEKRWNTWIVLERVSSTFNQ